MGVVVIMAVMLDQFNNWLARRQSQRDVAK
jgi:hypothetical protein